MLIAAPAVHAADLAVVIDDVGYNKVRGLRAINLPGDITIAVLPFAPHTQTLVKHAARRGKDIIIHQPMEPHPSPHALEEDGTLTLEMSQSEFAATVSTALQAVPTRVGLSNHTGSLLTAERIPMQRLMTQLNENGLFFLDSRTTPQTVAMRVAREHGVPALRRDVFLDHERNSMAIHKAFEKALRIARRRGHAVIIGHPYGISLDYLERRLADLPADIRLVSAAYLARRETQRQQDLNRPAMLAQPPRLTSLRISPGQ